MHFLRWQQRYVIERRDCVDDDQKFSSGWWILFTADIWLLLDAEFDHLLWLLPGVARLNADCQIN